MKLEKNMGIADRIIRPAIAASVIAAFATGKIKSTPGILLLVMSGFFILTSAVGSCPVYQALNIDTLEESQPSS